MPPRVLVLGGNPGRWHAAERAHEAPTMTGIEAWVFAFDGTYANGRLCSPKEAREYDIVIGNTNPQNLETYLRCMESRGSTKWVSLIEGSATDYLKPAYSLRAVLNGSDLVISINPASTPFLRILTTARVEDIGIPYPAESIRALSTPIAARRREAFLAPFLLTRWSEYFVAHKLGLAAYGYERRTSRKLKTLIGPPSHVLGGLRMGGGSLDPYALHKQVRQLYGDAQFEIRREDPLPVYLQHNGGAFLWLNLDDRYTWGRHVLDAAALQVPIITTRTPAHAEEFFPDLLLDSPFDVDRAVALGTRLMNDRDFYESSIDIPLDRFAKLAPNAMRTRLLEALQ